MFSHWKQGPPGSSSVGSPWHPGEVSLHRRYGLEDVMEAQGRRAIVDRMSDAHRAFFARLSFLVAGVVEPSGAVWATLVGGWPGFAHAPDPTRLAVAASLDAADPAAAIVRDGAPIGILGIDPGQRRRNRVNGRVAGVTPHGFAITVEHSFGNCPQYIRMQEPEPRQPESPSTNAAFAPDVAPRPAESASRLDAEAIATLARAQTVFVASYADTPAGRQVDVSHRGGPAGFVRVGDGGELLVPDYSGNFYFQTLGNILQTGRAGLVVADVASGDVLQITGAAAVHLDDPRTATFRGAERLWSLRPERMVRRRAAFVVHDRP